MTTHNDKRIQGSGEKSQDTGKTWSNMTISKPRSPTQNIVLLGPCHTKLDIITNKIMAES